MLAVHVATLEELTEKVQHLEDRLRELHLALSRRGLLNEKPDTPAASTKSRSLIRVLDEWSEGDAAEQRETRDYLKQTLDEDRPSDRKLYP